MSYDAACLTGQQSLWTLQKVSSLKPVYIWVLSFSPQAAEAAARQEARVSDVAAAKAQGALWAEGRNRPPVWQEKAVGLTRALAVAVSRSTPRAAAWDVATVRLRLASTATPPPSAPIITACPSRPTCLPTLQVSCLTIPWWWWWYHSTRTLPWQLLMRFLTRSRCPLPLCTQLYPHHPPPLQGGLLAPHPLVTWAPYPLSWLRHGSHSTWPWETQASSLWMWCSFLSWCWVTVRVQLAYSSHLFWQGASGSYLSSQGPFGLRALVTHLVRTGFNFKRENRTNIKLIHMESFV